MMLSVTSALNAFMQWLYLLHDVVDTMKHRDLDESSVNSPEYQQWLCLHSLRLELHVRYSSLGQSGIRALVDVRQPGGWRELREVLMQDRTRDIEKIALAQLSLDLAGAPDDCWKFFETIFQPGLRTSTIRMLSSELKVVPSTLMSRFFRAHLPAPKRYLAMARLTHAARVFENPGLSVANVANHLEYSSPQSFGRHVRTLLSITALQFRQRYDGEGMLHRFREELILPFAPTLRSFSPLTESLRWLGGRSTAEAVKLGSNEW